MYVELHTYGIISQTGIIYMYIVLPSRMHIIENYVCRLLAILHDLT